MLIKKLTSWMILINSLTCYLMMLYQHVRFFQLMMT